MRKSVLCRPKGQLFQWSVLLLQLGVLLSSVQAQKMVPLSSSEILHDMKRLKVLGAVLYVAAHPDDENTRFLAYMAREKQYRTGYLAMTRGDGGQNLIGDEQGIELGLIRTHELLGARRIDGAEQYFTRAYDFGFSKSTEEALAMWGREKVLSDAVWVIRKFRPDIIVTRFPEDARAGHGHHSASAVIAREAFIAAADPNRFTEQFKHGVQPWQAKRIMWNTFSFGSVSTTSEDQLKIDVGSYIPLLGKSIGEIAAEGRSQHRSQGFGSAASRGSVFEYFVHTLGDKALRDPMEGIATSWSRTDGGQQIESMVDQLIQQYNLHDPSASLGALIAIRKALSGLKDPYWKEQKIQEVDRLIRSVAGLHMEAMATKPFLAQGDTLRLNLLLNDRSGAGVKIGALEINGVRISPGVDLKKNANWTQSLQVPIPAQHPISQPYWLADPMALGSFMVKDQRMIGDPQNKPAFSVRVELEMARTPIVYEIPVMHRTVDPAKGEFLQPVFVTPRITLAKAPTPVLVNTANKKNKSEAAVNPNATAVPAPPVMRTIEYEHIPTTVYFSPGEQLQIVADIRTAGKTIGYVTGAGDKLPEMIRLMGFDVEELSEKDITPERLSKFDALVMGVRAYNVHDWLEGKYEILMEYVRKGGNMVVQYNTNSNAGPFRNKMAPKPFSISRNRVTEENATVEILDASDPLLNFPNKITEKDFEGWVQERGIYFADAFTPAYKPVLAMHDKGENDQKGSLIVCNEGKGRFIYTGLVFFRQLPAGVPGAFRLFANLISNPKSSINE